MKKVTLYGLLLIGLLSIQAEGLGQTAEDHFKNGMSKVNSGKKIDALADFNYAILKNDKYVDAYRSRADILSTVGDYTGVIRDYSKVIELIPNDKVAYMMRGKAFLSTGDVTSAFVDFNKAIDLDPNYVDAYTYRGLAENISANYHAAMKDFDKALELDPNNAQAYTYRGNSKYYLMDESGAEVDYNKAIELQPDMPEAYLNRGNYKFYIQDDVSNACPDWMKAKELGSVDAKLMVRKNCGAK
jgi:tetratricopeptide (TPR) repeat protein